MAAGGASRKALSRKEMRDYCLRKIFPGPKKIFNRLHESRCIPMYPELTSGYIGISVICGLFFKAQKAASAGEAGGDTQAARRGAEAWDPDGPGPLHRPRFAGGDWGIGTHPGKPPARRGDGAPGITPASKAESPRSKTRTGHSITPVSCFDRAMDPPLWPSSLHPTHRPGTG